MEPQAKRPRMPAEYGVPSDTENLLPWSYVNERMATAKHFWLATVTPAGTPHLRPIDGMWLDEKLYFGGSPDARWQRNLLANPAASIHLEDAEQAVILEGWVGIVRPDRRLAERLVEASNEKYGQNQKVEDYEGVEVGEFSPRLAFAWKVFFQDATRWRLVPD